VCCSALHFVAVCYSVQQVPSRYVTVLQCVAACCSVLQVCCSVLQCVDMDLNECRSLHEMSVCCSMLQRVAACCSVLQCVAVRCSVLPRAAIPFTICQCVAVSCSVLQVCCSVLQRVAVRCSVLQCVAVCCSALQRAASVATKSSGGPSISSSKYYSPRVLIKRVATMHRML